MRSSDLVKNIGIAILFQSIGSSCWADTIWSGETKITVLYPSTSTLMFNTEYANALSLCDSGKRFYLNINAPNYNVQASALMGAYYAGKKVSFAFDDSQAPSCAVEVDRFLVFD